MFSLHVISFFCNLSTSKSHFHSSPNLYCPKNVVLPTSFSSILLPSLTYPWLLCNASSHLLLQCFASVGVLVKIFNCDSLFLSCLFVFLSVAYFHCPYFACCLPKTELKTRVHLVGCCCSQFSWKFEAHLTPGGWQMWHKLYSASQSCPAETRPSLPAPTHQLIITHVCFLDRKPVNYTDCTSCVLNPICPCHFVSFSQTAVLFTEQTFSFE